MGNGHRGSSVNITLGRGIIGRFGVGGAIVSGVIRLGSGVRSWDLRDFPLLLLSCPRKVIIEMAIVSKDERESQFQRS